jgi:hypothetical protein
MPWWLIPDYVDGGWSKEEKSAWALIYLLATFASVAVFVAGLIAISLLGIKGRVEDLLLFFVSVPLGVLASRRICAILWPNLIRKADENAKKRTVEKEGFGRQASAPRGRAERRKHVASNKSSFLIVLWAAIGVIGIPLATFGNRLPSPYNLWALTINLALFFTGVVVSVIFKRVVKDKGDAAAESDDGA